MLDHGTFTFAQTRDAFRIETHHAIEAVFGHPLPAGEFRSSAAAFLGWTVRR
jgi:hypothetical protein